MTQLLIVVDIVIHVAYISSSLSSISSALDFAIFSRRINSLRRSSIVDESWARTSSSFTIFSANRLLRAKGPRRSFYTQQSEEKPLQLRIHVTIIMLRTSTQCILRQRGVNLV